MSEKIDPQWEDIDETKLTLAEKHVYRIRKRALEMYEKGKSDLEIFKATGMKHGAVLRLLKKCREEDPETGERAGYKALVPKSKTKKFTR